jgi:hypothetical protein
MQNFYLEVEYGEGFEEYTVSKCVQAESAEKYKEKWLADLVEYYSAKGIQLEETSEGCYSFDFHTYEITKIQEVVCNKEWEILNKYISK